MSENDISHVNVLKTVIVDDQELKVSDDASGNYFFRDPVAVGSTAMKCGGCNLLTVHEGFAVEGRPLTNDPAITPVSKRIYGCTNCGRISSK